MLKSRIPIQIQSLEEGSFHIFTSLICNSNFPCRAIIDTGASKTVFDKAFVRQFIDEFEKPDSNITSSGINNNIDEIEFAVIDQIQIGSFKIKDFQTAILDLEHINKIFEQFGHTKVSCLIGSDFLVKFNAIISYKTKKLILEYHDSSNQ